MPVATFCLGSVFMPVNSTRLNPLPPVHDVDASSAQCTAFARPRASPELMINKSKILRPQLPESLQNYFPFIWSVWIDTAFGVCQGKGAEKIAIEKADGQGSGPPWCGFFGTAARNLDFLCFLTLQAMCHFALDCS